MLQKHWNWPLRHHLTGPSPGSGRPVGALDGEAGGLLLGGAAGRFLRRLARRFALAALLWPSPAWPRRPGRPACGLPPRRAFLALASAAIGLRRRPAASGTPVWTCACSPHGNVREEGRRLAAVASRRRSGCCATPPEQLTTASDGGDRRGRGHCESPDRDPAHTVSFQHRPLGDPRGRNRAPGAGLPNCRVTGGTGPVGNSLDGSAAWCSGGIRRSLWSWLVLRAPYTRVQVCRMRGLTGTRLCRNPTRRGNSRVACESSHPCVWPTGFSKSAHTRRRPPRLWAFADGARTDG